MKPNLKLVASRRVRQRAPTPPSPGVTEASTKRFLDLLVARTPPERVEVPMRFGNEEEAAVHSRFIRKIARIHGHDVTVLKWSDRVFVWKNLSPEEDEVAMRELGEAVASLIPWGPRLAVVKPGETPSRGDHSTGHDNTH